MQLPRFHVLLFSLLVILVVVFSLSTVPAGPLVTDQQARGSFERTTPQSSALVEPVTNGSSLWPYTSKSRSVRTRTLGINLIVRGDTAEVRRFFRRETDGDWRARPFPAAPGDDPEPVLPTDETGLLWRDAHGSTRYTYVEPRTGGTEGTWMTESYQLYDGSYLGSRYHVRAYASPNPREGWTALQAHHEYWDWFRLRHTVTSVAEAQRHVEADVVRASGPESIWQLYADNGDTSDGNGWVTVVEFASLFVFLGWIRGRDSVLERTWARTAGEPRRMLQNAALFGSVIAVYLGVRVAGVALEQVAPTVSPKVIAGLLYPLLVIGLPLCTGYLARALEMEEAFLFTIVGVAVAVLLDFVVLDLAVIPVRLALHRITLVLSLGLIAAGAAYRARGGPRWNELLQIGVVGWLLALALPLVGIV